MSKNSLVSIYVLILWSLAVVPPLCSGLQEKCTRKNTYYTPDLGYGYNYICKQMKDAELHNFVGRITEKIQCTQESSFYDSYRRINTCNLFNRLDISKSFITHLPENTFRGFEKFTNFTSLSIVDASLSDIEDGAFRNLTKLQHLTLTDNKIRHMYDGFLGDLPELRKVLLENNTLEIFESTAVSDSLIELHLRNNTLKTVHLENLNRLTYLDLGINKLMSLNDSFNGIKSLSTLSLQYNLLENVRAEDFRVMSKLQYLDLEGNHISSLDGESFSVMTDLRTLYLNNNAITTLPVELFANNNALSEIHLNDNKLTRLENKTFDGLRNVTILDLSQNSLTELDSAIFVDTKIASFHIDNNALTSVDMKLFQKIECSKLTITRNHLRTINMAQVTCNLDASFNKIEELLYVEEDNDTATNNSAQVKWILLDNNRITKLETGLFHRFPNLNMLSLTHNRITELPFGVFDGVNKLQELYLSYNLLTEIHPAILAPLNKLQYLSVSHNHLRTLEMEDILENKSITMFDIDYNAWECTYLYKMLLGARKNRDHLKLKTVDDKIKAKPHNNSVYDVQCFKPEDIIVFTTDTPWDELTTENLMDNQKSTTQEVDDITISSTDTPIVVVNPTKKGSLKNSANGGVARNRTTDTQNNEIISLINENSRNTMEVYERLQSVLQDFANKNNKSVADEKQETPAADEEIISLIKQNAQNTNEVYGKLQKLIEDSLAKENGETDRNADYEKLQRLIEDKLGKTETAASVADNKKDQLFSDYQLDMRGQKAGIVILVILVLVIGSISLYILYETRRYRNHMRIHRMSTNTMVEDI